MKSKLTVLGSGVCYSSFYKPFDFRNPSGHLLQVNGKNILVDVGDGIRRKMEEMRFDYYNLDTIFISHFHPDHFSIDSFIQAFFVRAKKTKRLKNLSIYGPKKIKEIFIAIWNKKNIPSYEKSFPGLLEIKFYEYQDRKRMQIDNLAIIPFKVIHGGMDAYALRFIIGDKVLAYSGDAAKCREIVEAAKGADIFLCEAGNNIGDEKNKDLIHLTPYQAGEIGYKAAVKKLVLVHYSGKDTKEEMRKEVKRAGFGGIAEVAEDLDTFSI